MIAISYRREDSLPIAGRLYDRLRKVLKSLKPHFKVRCVYHFATSALRRLDLKVVT
jgi:hypothetical protein